VAVSSAVAVASSVGGRVLDRDVLVAKLPAHGDDLSELLYGRIALLEPCWHDRDVFCDQWREPQRLPVLSIAR
jgi:hypothetical protein